MCYECVTSVLRVCYECVTSVLRVCYKCVTSLLPVCYECVFLLSHVKLGGTSIYCVVLIVQTVDSTIRVTSLTRCNKTR